MWTRGLPKTDFQEIYIIYAIGKYLGEISGIINKWIWKIKLIACFIGEGLIKFGPYKMIE